MPELHVKRYLITGLLACIPLWITWVAFKFVVTLLAGVGASLVTGIVDLIGVGSPAAAAVGPEQLPDIEKSRPRAVEAVAR